MEVALDTRGGCLYFDLHMRIKWLDEGDDQRREGGTVFKTAKTVGLRTHKLEAILAQSSTYGEIHHNLPFSFFFLQDPF